jgi:ABC-type transport system involved in cytochrome c biogenesis permease subunit
MSALFNELRKSLSTHLVFLVILNTNAITIVNKFVESNKLGLCRSVSTIEVTPLDMALTEELTYQLLLRRYIECQQLSEATNVKEADCEDSQSTEDSLLSVAVLLVDREGVLELRSSSIGSGGYRQASAAAAGGGELELSSGNFRLSEQLDSLSYRTITVGFLLLSVGLVSGAVWANEAWGSWWSWDPKETWALICWLVYAAYLHTRLIRGWQGRRPAVVAAIGLVVIAVCYIGVNLLGIGLHSYGWFFGDG